MTTTLEYQGRVMARAHPSGSRASHCAGITFEVFFRAMQQWNKDLGLCPGDFNGMTSNKYGKVMKNSVCLARVQP